MEQFVNPPNQDYTPEDAKAALGISTRLSKQMLMPQMLEEDRQNGFGQQPAPQEPEMALEQEETPDPMETVKEELKSFKKEIKDMVKREIGSIREDINKLLEEGENEEEKD